MSVTLTNQITFHPINGDYASIPNRVPLMYLTNDDRKQVGVGWFLTGGNAAGLEQEWYIYRWSLDKGFLFEKAPDNVTHWGYPYPERDESGNPVEPLDIPTLTEIFGTTP